MAYISDLTLVYFQRLGISSEDIQKAAERLYKYSLLPERNSSAVIIDKSKKNKKNTGIIVDLPL